MVTKESVDKAEAKWARLEDKATEAEDAAVAAYAKADAKSISAYYDVKKADEAWDKYRKLKQEYEDERRV